MPDIPDIPLKGQADKAAKELEDLEKQVTQNNEQYRDVLREEIRLYEGLKEDLLKTNGMLLDNARTPRS
jgi:hypothetical protein